MTIGLEVRSGIRPVAFCNVELKRRLLDPLRVSEPPRRSCLCRALPSYEDFSKRLGTTAGSLNVTVVSTRLTSVLPSRTTAAWNGTLTPLMVR